MKLIISTILSLTLLTSALFSEIRQPKDRIGFCWKKEQIERLISFLDKNDKSEKPEANIIAGISPHDDYLYAGRVFLPLYKHLRCREVLIFGVTHGTVRRKIGDPSEVVILDSHSSWAAPYGNIEVSPLREKLRKELPANMVMVNNKAHKLEHSIEALLPFLQYYNRDVKITPVMVTRMDSQVNGKIAEKISSIVTSYIKEKNMVPGKDFVILISSDANHYGTAFKNTPWGVDKAGHSKGVARDKEVAGKYLTESINAEKIEELSSVIKREKLIWCGRYSIPMGMMVTINLCRNLNLNPSGKLLSYSDTYTEGVLPIKDPGYGITAPFSLSHWVGFFSTAIINTQE